PPSPASQGKGQPSARRPETRAFASPVHGGSSPEGGEGGALDLALNHQDQDQKPAPFRTVGTITRYATEGRAIVIAAPVSRDPVGKKSTTRPNGLIRIGLQTVSNAAGTTAEAAGARVDACGARGAAPICRREFRPRPSRFRPCTASIAV